MDQIDELNEIGSYPKKSSSIEVASTPDEAKPYFLLKNQRSGKFLKLGKNEYSVLCALDGHVNVYDIHQKFKDRFEPRQIDELVKLFYTMRLLEKDCIDPELEKKVGVIHRFLMNFTYEKIFKIKIKITEPDRLIEALYSNLRFFFNKYFFIFSMFLCFAGTGLFILNVGLSLNVLWEGFVNGEILLLAFPFMVVIIMHEFAHGLATKHYGGVIYEMGVMFFYFRPAFYCNVTDSYRFKKWQRAAVSMAGIYFQLLIVSILMIGWQFAGRPMGIGGRAIICFAVMNMVTNLINFIPLIKLDGYWALTALSNIDNLRQKSFNYVNALFFYKIISKTKSNYILKQSSRKERNIYLIYGLLAIIFTFLLVIYILIQFGMYMILHLGVMGFVGFILAVATLSIQSLVFLKAMLSDVFQGGTKSVLRFFSIILVAGLVLGLMMNYITVDFSMDALYRIQKTGEIKVYLNKSNLLFLKNGQSIMINIYKNGVVSRYNGSILESKPKKELYFMTNINFSSNPRLFSGEEKYAVKAEIQNADSLFTNYKSGTVSIIVGKIKLSKYIIGVFHQLIPW